MDAKPTTTDLSDEDIARIQEQMFNLGALLKNPKTSGGNRYHMPKTRRIARRKMQKASRKSNRPKK